MSPQDPNCNLPRISIVMSTYNRAPMLQEALSAIVRMDPPAYEVILIDDGSTDDTPRVLSHFDTLLQYERQANSGKSRAINKAVEKASGDWIWICDDDDCVVADAVSVFGLSIQTAASVDFHYSMLGDLVVEPDGSLIAKERGMQTLPAVADLFCALLAGLWIPCLPSLIVRKSVFTSLGGLCEDLKRVEDEQFALRLVRNCSGARVPSTTYLVRKHDGERGTANSRFANSQREDIDIRYLQNIYREALESYPLATFSCANAKQLGLPGDPRLFRLIVAFRICLWNRVQEELQSLDNLFPSQSDLALVENTIARLVDEFSMSKIDSLLTAPLFRLLLQEKIRPVCQAIGRGILRGLYWSVVRDVRNRATGMAIRKSRRLVQTRNFLPKFHS